MNRQHNTKNGQDGQDAGRVRETVEGIYVIEKYVLIDSLFERILFRRTPNGHEKYVSIAALPIFTQQQGCCEMPPSAIPRKSHSQTFAEVFGPKDGSGNNRPAKSHQRSRKTAQRSSLEQQFLTLCQMVASNLPPPIEQFRFHPTRNWRFDFAWPDAKVAVELEGGTWSRRKMAHNAGAGIQRDIHKHNAAVVEGWRVFRYTTKDLDSRPALVIQEVANEVYRWLRDS